jgi:exonuclease SbcC
MTWQPLTRESAKETQAELERILGLNRRTFSASSYLAQGDGGNFCEASPADRKAILSDILDPRGYWPGVAKRAAADRLAAERILEVDAARISEREETVSQQHATETLLDHHRSAQEFARSGVEDAEFVLETAQAAVAGNAAAVERARAASDAERRAEADSESARIALEVAREQAERLEPARVELAELEQQTARIPELEANVEASRRAIAARESAERELAAAKLEHQRQHQRVLDLERDHDATDDRRDKVALQLLHLEEAEDGAERCDRCQQILGREARTAAIVNMQAECDALNEQLVEKKSYVRMAQTLCDEMDEKAREIVVPPVPEINTAGLERARSAAERRGAVALLIEGYTDAAARVPQLARDLQAAEGTLAMRAAESVQAASQVGDTPELQRVVGEAFTRQRSARLALDEANAQVTRTEEQLNRIQEAQADLIVLKAANRERHQELDLLRLAERAFGRDGIPTLIVENTLDQLETNANTYLKMMPTEKGVLRVELETQRVQKTVENLRETLDINVCDEHTRRPYETYSGGEQTRLNVALRLALAILLADRRGAESRLLAMDEPESLDEAGRRDLIEVIKSVSNRFDVIIVASQYPDIKDAFDHCIELAIGEDGVSRLVAA